MIKKDNFHALEWDDEFQGMWLLITRYHSLIRLLSRADRMLALYPLFRSDPQFYSHFNLLHEWKEALIVFYSLFRIYFHCPSNRLVLTYDDIPGEEDGEGSFFGTPPQSYHTKSSNQTNLPHVEMVRPAQTQPEVVKEEEKKPVKKEYSEDEKRHIMMNDEFKKFIDRAVRITERALYYNEPNDIFADYSGAREKHERYVRLMVLAIW